MGHRVRKIARKVLELAFPIFFVCAREVYHIFFAENDSVTVRIIYYRETCFDVLKKFDFHDSS